MKNKSYNTLGKFMLCFSIIASLLVVFLSFRCGNGYFIENLNNSTFFSSLLSIISSILITIAGFAQKKRYPEYYKYQVASGIIFLSTCLIFDIIPKIIFLIL